MLKNEEGKSLINLIIWVIIGLVFMVLIANILVGENGLINQIKNEVNDTKTEYIIKTNTEYGNAVVIE